jgi:hypothetical protein
MLLNGKRGIIFGAGGAIGSAVARGVRPRDGSAGAPLRRVTRFNAPNDRRLPAHVPRP